MGPVHLLPTPVLTRFVLFRAANIVKQYPILETGGTIDVLIPKKEKVIIAKW